MPYVTTVVRPDGTVQVTVAADPERDNLASLQLAALADESHRSAVAAHQALFSAVGSDEPDDEDE